MKFYMSDEKMVSSRTSNDLIVGERFHNLVSSGILIPHEWYDDRGDQKYGYEVGENKRATDYMRNLRSAIKGVAQSKTPPCKQWNNANAVRYTMAQESRLLWHAIRGIGYAPKAWGREKEMHPYLRLGVHLARKWEPRLRFFTNTSSELLVGEEYPRRALTHVVKVIRRVCRSKKFKQRIAQLERRESENFASCCNYFMSILRTHARPLVLRADLYVEAEAKKAAEEGKIEQAVEKFIRNLREDRIVSDVLGYIIKREHGYDRGIHLHLMVILDGDKHFQSYKLTETIKMYWVHECVGSPQFASGFNCYLRKDEYLYNAIGLVHYADESMLRGVLEAIKYLTKTDGDFLLPEAFGKNMRKGQPPKRPQGEVQRGAPRKFGNDTLLAESILLGRKAADRLTVKRSRRA
ncbi:hypothetical protein [Rhodanobacter sp. BL-MT-08]